MLRVCCSKVTQIPWYDKYWNKNSIVAMRWPPTGLPILKIVANCIGERRQKLKDNGGVQSANPVNDGDMLSRFLDVHLTDADVPSW